MKTYEVGKPYPHPTSPAVDQGRASFNEAFLDILFFSSQASTDAHEWKSGKLSLSLFQRNSVPFLVASFPSFTFDISLNLFKVESNKVDAWLNGRGNMITLLLLDPVKTIHAMRTISISHANAEVIRNVLEKQDGRYETYAEVDLEIGNISSQLQPTDMKKLGQVIFSS